MGAATGAAPSAGDAGRAGVADAAGSAGASGAAGASATWGAGGGLRRGSPRFQERDISRRENAFVKFAIFIVGHAHADLPGFRIIGKQSLSVQRAIFHVRGLPPGPGWWLFEVRRS